MTSEFGKYPDFSSKGEPNCSDYDTDLFFPDPDSVNFYYIMREAKKVCIGCPYMAECLAYAIENNEPGVWGGTYEYERKQMKRARRLGLPAPTYKKPKRWSGT